MLSGRQIRGLAVYTQEPHQAIGRVIDVVADRNSGALLGLIIAAPSMLSRNLYLPAERIHSLDINGVSILDKQSLVKGRIPQPGLSHLGLRGRPVLDSDGMMIGSIADYIADNHRLLGFELSHGLMQDLRQGREFLSWREFTDYNLL